MSLAGGADVGTVSARVVVGRAGTGSVVVRGGDFVMFTQAVIQNKVRDRVIIRFMSFSFY